MIKIHIGDPVTARRERHAADERGVHSLDFAELEFVHGTDEEAESAIVNPAAADQYLAPIVRNRNGVANDTIAGKSLTESDTLGESQRRLRCVTGPS